MHNVMFVLTRIQVYRVAFCVPDKSMFGDSFAALCNVMVKSVGLGIGRTVVPFPLSYKAYLPVTLG